MTGKRPAKRLKSTTGGMMDHCSDAWSFRKWKIKKLGSYGSVSCQGKDASQMHGLFAMKCNNDRRNRLPALWRAAFSQTIQTGSDLREMKRSSGKENEPPNAKSFWIRSKRDRPGNWKPCHVRSFCFARSFYLQKCLWGIAAARDAGDLDSLGPLVQRFHKEVSFFDL